MSGRNKAKKAGRLATMTWDQARAKARREGGQVMALYKPGRPARYTVIRRDATDEEAAATAFRLTHGREPTEDEMAIWRMDKLRREAPRT